MTDIPGGSIIAHGPFEIASIKPPPQYLTIGSLVRISLDDGSIEYGDSYTPDEAARTFWDAMSKAYGSPEAVFGHGLAARVDAEMASLRERAEQAEAAIARVRQVHHTMHSLDGKPMCAAECETPPCPTIQALEQP